jgi:hypothetical protein
MEACITVLMSNEESRKDDYRLSLSPTLITKYAHKSSRLIYSIEKNIFIVIGVVAALAAISVIDTLEITGITDFINENLDDPIIAVLSLISLAALLPILRLSFQSKRTLEDWAEMFEHNSIKNSISMSLTSLSKDDALRAVAETVEEVGDLLLQYIEKGEPSEFFDRDVAGDIYDVLVDSETVKEEKGTDLKKVLADYGAIIIKIVDGRINRNEVASFSDSLSAYAMHMRRKNAVGLAIMVGREVSPEAYSGRVKVKDILLIEKP